MEFNKSSAFVAVFLFAVCAQQALAAPSASEKIVSSVEEAVFNSVNKIQKNADAIENYINKNIVDQTIQNFISSTNFHKSYEMLISSLNLRDLAGDCLQAYEDFHINHHQMFDSVNDCVSDQVHSGIEQAALFLQDAKYLAAELVTLGQNAKKCVLNHAPVSSQALRCASDAELKTTAFIKSKVPPMMVKLSKQYGNILGMSNNIKFCSNPKHTAKLQAKYDETTEDVAKCLIQNL